SHAPAEPHDRTGADDAHGRGHGAAHDADAGHGHGPWHGPHESPSPMTYPLMALAIGAMVAGLIGIPAALGGGNTIEHFLEPSFTAEHHVVEGAAPAAEGEHGAAATAEHEAAPHASRQVELGLMLFSVLIAVVGILVA